jgi:hypothetical protein
MAGYARWGYPETMLGEVRSGLIAGLRHPAISDEAARSIVATILLAPHLEHAWRCGWDSTAGQITSALWIATGTADRLAYSDQDVTPGEIVVHNHPATRDYLAPSETDLQTAADLVPHGIGSAIIDNTLQQWILIRAPGFGHRATYGKHRTFSFGRFRVQFTSYTIKTHTRPK